MRVLVLVAAMLASAAVQADECQRGRGILEVSEWSARLTNDSFAPVELTTTLAHTGDRAFKMIDGGVWFYDALGRDIIGVSLDPDLSLAPSETSTSTGNYMRGTGERLASLATEDVVAVVCVRSILYSDGTKEEF